MRLSLLVTLLGAALMALMVSPAAAGRTVHVAHRPHNRMEFPPFFFRHNFAAHHFFNHNLLGFGPVGPFIADGDIEDGAPATIVETAPPARAPLRLRPATDERASVETTLQGVVIVRGPGSRHVMR